MTATPLPLLRWRRHAATVAIVAACVAAAPLLLAWLAYGARLTARDIDAQQP